LSGLAPAERLLQSLGVTEPEEIDLEAVAWHIDPEPPRLGPAQLWGQHRHQRMVAVDLGGREDVPPDARHDRIEQLTLLWHFRLYGICEEHVTVRTSSE